MVREGQGEQQPREGEEPLRSFAETLPELFFQLSAAGEVTALSPACRTMRGFAPEQYIGCHYLACINPDDHSLVAKSFDLLLSGVRGLEIVLQMVSRDGMRIWAEIHASPRLAGEKIVGVQGIIRDISERKMKGKVPRRSDSWLSRRVREQDQELWRNAGERQPQVACNELEQVFNVAVPFCLLSLDCRILKVNQAFCDFFSTGREDILGKSGQDIWGCDACDTEECFLSHLPAGADKAYRAIDQVVRGRHLVCTLHAVPYINANGRLSGLVVTFFDKREQKKTAADLRNARQQLIQAEKLSAIGSLVASIAHEFNNPLCGVRSVVERMARKLELAVAEQGLLELALEQCDRMKRLIRNLQQFNLPFSDARKDFELHPAIDSVLVLLNKHLKTRKVMVRKEYAAEGLMLTGVENQIKQVLLNLIKNSGEAMAEAGGEIRVLTRRDRDTVHIAVSDTGVGISPERLPHIFEPFFTTTTDVKETGLGLAVAHDIVKGHQGEIRVESIPDQGTTFTVILPTGNTVDNKDI